MQDTLEQCERDVEQARAKLARDLTVLRAPETFAAFTDDLKQEAVKTKDEWMERAKESLHARGSLLIEQLKARAAENPAAAVMIGAGVAWYLLRHPPITPGLIGLGIYQLWRTDAHQQPYINTQTYLDHGRRRLREQAYAAARETAEVAASALSSGRDKVVSKAGEVFDRAKGTVVDLKNDVREQSEEVANGVREFVTEQIGSGQSEVLQRGTSRMYAELGKHEATDRTLLNIAGVAVAAALCLAMRRQSAS